LEAFYLFDMLQVSIRHLENSSVSTKYYNRMER
jgi:hypothetical protein